MGKMRIAIFTDSFWPEINGASISIRNSAELLAKSGHKIMIFAPSYGNFDRYNKGFLTRFHRYIRIQRHYSLCLASYRDVQAVFPNIFRIFSTLNRFRPDVVHIHTFSSMGIAGIIYAKKKGVFLIGTFHTLVTEQLDYVSIARLFGLHRMPEKSAIKRLWRMGVKAWRGAGLDKIQLKRMMTWSGLKAVYNRCDLVLTPTETIRKVLGRKGFLGPFRVVSNGIDLEDFPMKKDFLLRKRIIFVGRLSYEKNIDVLLRAMKIVAARYRGIEFVLCGDGPEKEKLKAYSKRLGIESNIVFKGLIDYRELHKEYHDADVFITASTMETQGISLLEAFSCGLPAVGVRKFAIPDLVVDNETGFLCNPGDHKAIAKKIMLLLSDERLRIRLSRNARATAEEHELSLCTKRLEETYRRMSRNERMSKMR